MEARLTARSNSPHMVNGEWVRGCPCRGRCVSERVVMDQFAGRRGGRLDALEHRSVIDAFAVFSLFSMEKKILKEKRESREETETLNRENVARNTRSRDDDRHDGRSITALAPQSWMHVALVQSNRVYIRTGEPVVSRSCPLN